MQQKEQIQFLSNDDDVNLILIQINLHPVKEKVGALYIIELNSVHLSTLWSSSALGRNCTFLLIPVYLPALLLRLPK